MKREEKKERERESLRETEGKQDSNIDSVLYYTIKGNQAC
jgi:hypothetical protein